MLRVSLGRRWISKRITLVPSKTKKKKREVRKAPKDNAVDRIDGDGNGLRRLAIDQVHTLCPQLMADGRLTYTRWDYSDRGQNYTHPLFSMR